VEQPSDRHETLVSSPNNYIWWIFLYRPYT